MLNMVPAAGRERVQAGKELSYGGTIATSSPFFPDSGG